MTFSGGGSRTFPFERGFRTEINGYCSGGAVIRRVGSSASSAIACRFFVAAWVKNEAAAMEEVVNCNFWCVFGAMMLNVQSRGRCLCRREGIPSSSETPPD